MIDYKVIHYEENFYFAHLRRCAASVRRWLQAEHDFFAADGDPLRLSGAKFVDYICVVAVVALLLCIQF